MHFTSKTETMNDNFKLIGLVCFESTYLSNLIKIKSLIRSDKFGVATQMYDLNQSVYRSSPERI